MDDLDAKRFKCALGLSSMVAQAGTPADAKVMFSCHECSMSKMRRCAGPVEYTPQKEPIIIMPKEKTDPPKRRGRKPKVNSPEFPSPGTKAAVQLLDAPAPAAEDPREELARKALMELANRPRPEIRLEIVRTFCAELAAARKSGCGWGRISKTLKQFGYEIGEYALQKNFEKLNQA